MVVVDFLPFEPKGIPQAVISVSSVCLSAVQTAQFYIMTILHVVKFFSNRVKKEKVTHSTICTKQLSYSALRCFSSLTELTICIS